MLICVLMQLFMLFCRCYDVLLCHTPVRSHMSYLRPVIYPTSTCFLVGLYGILSESSDKGPDGTTLFENHISPELQMASKMIYEYS